MLLFFLLFVCATTTTTFASFTPLEQSQLLNFQTYLRINTAHPTPNYSPATSFLLSHAAEVGLQAQTLHFTAQKTKPLVLLTWPGTDPTLPSLLLNSHLDSVPAEPDKWVHPPFSAFHDPTTGKIYARGAQDDKCIAIQYLEAIRQLKASGYTPLRSVHISLVPDEEIGGADGMEAFVKSEQFRALHVGFMLDEGQASVTDEFRVFYADRLPWRLVVRAVGPPGHGSRMFDGVAVENLMECVETVARFRDAQFEMVKSGRRAASEVVSVNPVYMKAGVTTPKVFKLNLYALLLV